MTVHPTHQGHLYSTKIAGIALAGAVLTVGAGYGVANYVLDESAASITETPEAPVVNPDAESGLFPGTDREERDLMHRRD